MNGLDYKYRRHRLNLTQSYVAKEIDISRYTLSGYETGRVEIPITVAFRLSKLYGITESEINKV
jgi:DNA-binding XRE family transcriptional regulator